MYEWSCSVIAAISLNVQRAQMYICYVQQMETVFYLCSNSSSRFSPIWLYAHIYRVCASVNLDQLRKHILGLSMNLFMPVLTEMHFTRNFASSSHSLIRIYSCIHTYIYTYNMYYDRIELTRIFILIWFFFSSYSQRTESNIDTYKSCEHIVITIIIHLKLKNLNWYIGKRWRSVSFK